MFIHGWPYTDLHGLNLDWIIEKVKEMHDFTTPKNGGEWDKNKSYEPLTFVTNNGTSYISVEPVPRGVEIDDPYYWYNLQVDFSELVNSVLFFPLAGNTNDKSKSMAVICTDGAAGQKRLVLRGIGPTGITSQITLVDANGRVQLPSAIPVPLVEGGTGANNAAAARAALGITPGNIGAVPALNPSVTWLLGDSAAVGTPPFVVLRQSGGTGERDLCLVATTEGGSTFHKLITQEGARAYALITDNEWKATSNWDTAYNGAVGDIKAVIVCTDAGNTNVFTIDIPKALVSASSRFFYGTAHAYAGSTDIIYYYQIQVRQAGAQYFSLYKNGALVTDGAVMSFLYR